MEKVESGLLIIRLMLRVSRNPSLWIWASPIQDSVVVCIICAIIPCIRPSVNIIEPRPSPTASPVITVLRKFLQMIFHANFTSLMNMSDCPHRFRSFCMSCLKCREKTDGGSCNNYTYGRDPVAFRGYRCNHFPEDGTSVIKRWIHDQSML